MNFIKNKGFTIINIARLAIGLALFILISLYIQLHLDYNKSVKKYKYIYRIDQKVGYAGVKKTYPCTPFPLGARLIRYFPDIRCFDISYNFIVIFNNYINYC
jgi:putative ABC transport system permease protein